jgi:micrococcal nuclease
MDLKLFTFPVIAYHVVDGDTIKVWLDLGFRRYQGRGDNSKTWESLRVAGIDTPEKRTRDQLEKRAGKAATAAVSRWLESRAASGQIMAHSISKDKFDGRFVGDLFVLGDDDDCLSKYMIDNGWAREYHGGTKHEWSDEQLKVIIEKAVSQLGDFV